MTTDRDAEFDQQLRELLAEDAPASTPDVSVEVAARIRARKRLPLVAAVAAAVLCAVGVGLWQAFQPADEIPLADNRPAGPVQEAPPPEAEPSAPFGPPPVDPLAVVSQQQDALLNELEQMSKEF